MYLPLEAAAKVLGPSEEVAAPTEPWELPQKAPTVAPRRTPSYRVAPRRTASHCGRSFIGEEGFEGFMAKQSPKGGWNLPGGPTE